jgi:hypothetical protein
MALVNMAIEDDTSLGDYTPNPYGYGLTICLTEEQCEMLGLNGKPPAAGSSVGIRAIAKVSRITQEYDPAKEAAEGENPDDIDVRLELQITDLEITQAGQSADDSASLLYGDGNG